MQNNYTKPLIYLKPGDRFTWNNIVHTVEQHQGRMTEVSMNEELKAWPNVNSKGLVRVNQVY